MYGCVCVYGCVWVCVCVCAYLGADVGTAGHLASVVVRDVLLGRARHGVVVLGEPHALPHGLRRVDGRCHRFQLPANLTSSEHIGFGGLRGHPWGSRVQELDAQGHPWGSYLQAWDSGQQLDRSQNIKQIERIHLAQLEGCGKFDQIGSYWGVLRAV